MKYENGTILVETFGGEEFLIMLGYSNMLGGSPTTCSCLIVEPCSNNDYGKIVGIKLVDECNLMPADKPRWVDYINVSW